MMDESSTIAFAQYPNAADHPLARMLFSNTEDGKVIPTDRVLELFGLFEEFEDGRFPDDVSVEIGEVEGTLVLILKCRYRIAQLRQAESGEWGVVPWSDVAAPLAPELMYPSFPVPLDSLAQYDHSIPGETAAHMAEVDRDIAEYLRKAGGQ